MKKSVLNIILFILIIFVSGCSREMSPSTGWNYTEDDFLEDRKIIFSARLHLYVQNQDSTQKQVQKIAQKYKGYISVPVLSQFSAFHQQC